jgi:acyl-CoA thioesterase FadM
VITKLKHDKEVLCAEGKSVIVCFNYQINQTVEIPLAWKDAVMKFEGQLQH